MNAKFQRPRVSQPVSAPTSDRHSGEFIQTTSRSGGWRWFDLLLSLGLASLLTWSWLWPRGRSIWNQVDATMFRFFNGALAIEWWRKGWAYLNHDYCDWVGLVLFTGLLAYAARYGKRSLRRSVISVALLAIMVIGVRGGSQLAMKLSQGGLGRPSPTLANADAWRLNSLVPDVVSKDASAWCFPSDHGFVVLAILLYLGYRGPDRAVHVGLVLAAVFVVPRWVAGAHWFTDVAIGSAVMALLGTSLLMATPLHEWAVSQIERRSSSLGRKTGSRAAAPSGLTPAVPRPSTPGVETPHLGAQAGS
jgi:membrane-associated phospholipid phosphatase